MASIEKTSLEKISSDINKTLEKLKLAEKNVDNQGAKNQETKKKSNDKATAFTNTVENKEKQKSNNGDNGVPLVSVIIPSYNRYKYVCNAVKSVIEQTYGNIEIIVVNDRSPDPGYYREGAFPIGVKLIHLEKNTKKQYGFPCPGHVRNVGMREAKGEYIAFLDDDDYWHPEKLQKQIEAMQRTGHKMCSTNGYHSWGFYNGKNRKQLFFGPHVTNRLPDVWTNDTIKSVNYFICSSVVVHKDIIEKAGECLIISIHGKTKGLYVDYEHWKQCLKYTKSYFIKEPLVYYDVEHGGGWIS